MKRTSQFQYSVARYTPDPIRGEAVNVGVILQDMSSGVLYPRFIETFRRVRAFDPAVNLDALKLMLTVVERGMINRERDPGFLEELPQHVSGLITFSEVQGGITTDMSRQLSTLFGQFVEEKRNQTSRRGFTQRSTVARVKKDFQASQHQILKEMERFVASSAHHIEFELGRHRNGVPPIVVQPVSLDQGDVDNKLAKAKEYAYNADALREMAGYNDALCIALVQTPVVASVEGAIEAEEILGKSFTTIRMDARNEYLDQVMQTIQP